MRRVAVQSTLPQTQNEDTLHRDEARQPRDEPAQRLGQVLRAIGEDARHRAASYPTETLVPEGGE